MPERVDVRVVFLDQDCPKRRHVGVHGNYSAKLAFIGAKQPLFDHFVSGRE
jgi:hypothetical protein